MLKTDYLQYINFMAMSHNKYSAINTEVGKRLFEIIYDIKITPKNILDLGCLDGYFTKELTKTFPDANIISMDHREDFLKLANIENSKLFNINETRLPFPNNSFDIIFSNNYLSLFEIKKIVDECYRVLKPNGLLLFSLYGPDTTKEIKLTEDSKQQKQNFQEFLFDMHDIGDILLKKFISPIAHAELIKFLYKDPTKLLNEVKHNINATIKVNDNIYQLEKEGNYFKLSAELITAHAWVPSKKEIDIVQN